MVAGSVELPVGLVDIRLYLGELLERPFGDIDKDLYLLSCCGIEPCDSALELVTELAVVAEHEVEDVDHFAHPFKHEDSLCPSVLREMDKTLGEAVPLRALKMTLLKEQALVEELDHGKAGRKKAKAAIPDEKVDELKDAELNLVWLGLEVLRAVRGSLGSSP